MRYVFVLLSVVAVFTTVIYFLATVAFSEHRYLILSEGGIIETLSAFGYFVCAAVIVHIGRWQYVKSHYFFFFVSTLMGLRELDFDKKFTTLGIFKSRFYLGDQVPLTEKLIGLAVVSFIAFNLYMIYKRYIKESAFNFKNLNIYQSISASIIIVALIAKTLDGFSRKMKSFNINVNEEISIMASTLEEIMELSIPCLMTFAFIHFFRSTQNDSRESLKPGCKLCTNEY